MQNTQVKHIMQANPVIIGADDTLQDAARLMRENDCGILPVGTEDNLQGIITDRDIVVRAISEGKDPKREKVRDYMTQGLHTCSETETLLSAAGKMRENGVSRLIIQRDDGKLSGILTFGRILRKNNDREEVFGVVSSATGKKAA